MDIFIGQRGSGRTTKLIKMSAAGQGTIVAATQAHCCYIKDMAAKMELSIPEPIIFAEFINMIHHYPEKTWLIDNLDGCLESLQIAAATICLDSVKPMDDIQIMYH